MSDHRPVRATVRLQQSWSQHHVTRKPTKVKWEALRIPEVAAQYAEATAQMSATWNESISWAETNREINQTAARVCETEDRSVLEPWMLRQRTKRGNSAVL